jgi:phosphohistidine phosphatase
MDLILWRHAEAEDTSPDDRRRLTKKGRDQAERVGRWLEARLPSYRLLSSPAARARETAEGLSTACEILPELYAGAPPMELLEAAGWPHAGGVVILVGHQPLLGEIAAQLMTRRSEPWSMKKGAIWWFKTEETGRGFATELVAVLPPKLA